MLIVDDHPLLRVGASTYLSSREEFTVVGESDNAVEAFELAKSCHPDVVLLDIRLRGDHNGVDLARWIHTELPNVHVLVLTNFYQEPYVRAMMECGVDGYLLKDTPPSDIANAVIIVAGGRTVYSARVDDQLKGQFLSPIGGRSKSALERLTPREMDVLNLITIESSTREVAARLSISIKGVQQHLTSIYSKLSVQNRTEAIVTAARAGLIVLDNEGGALPHSR